MFLHLSKPVANLNNPEKRNNQETLDRNLRHLGKITAQNVTRGIEDDIRGMLEELSESITQSTARHAEEIAKYVGRIERLEENERLTARAQIEKQDAVRPLPTYPRQGASSEVFQKALTATGLAVKVIERKTLFSADPFNFIMVLATESNKIAHAHRLTSSQQRDLILSYIPTNSPEYSLLELCGTLQEMFAVISTYSDQVYTRAELEKKINQWTLNNSSHRALRQSVVALLELLQKTTDHDFMNDKPELFRLCITRIQMEKLPMVIHTALNEARMKIRSTDTMVDLTQTLLAALNRYVGMKPPKGATAKLEVARQDPYSQYHGAVAYPVFPPQLATPIPPPAMPVPEKKGNGNRDKRSQGKGGNKQQRDRKGRERSASRGRNSKGNDGKNSPRNGDKKKPSFVTPWPENKPYMSKNGNQLSEAFNDHFRDFCFRCGHSSHQGRDCRTYPDRTPIMTLCTRCRQGLHEDCKSKRRDLVGGGDNNMAEMKQIMQAQAMLLRGLMITPGGVATYPATPTPAIQNKSNPDTETSDED
jgi:hypothetical protein